uniref:Uncharacterized protein n=1 Tax=Solanum tuberosum TaxID=4113 RepID=M1DMI6_SOLTU
MENRLILGGHNRAANESKPIACSYTQVPLLDRDSCLGVVSERRSARQLLSSSNDVVVVARNQVTICRVEIPDPCRNVGDSGPGDLLKTKVLECLPHPRVFALKAYVESSFSSRIIRHPSTFSLLSSQGGGTTGGTGATGGARTGVESSRLEFERTLAELGQDIARISAHRESKGWSSSSLEKAVWRPSLSGWCFGASDTGHLPFPLSPFGGSVPPLFGGLAHPSFIVIPRALFRGGMSRLVLAISAKHQQKLGIIWVKA